jgi:hypothetical protein
MNSVVSVLWAGEFLHDLIQAETRWLLAGRERLEGLEALSHTRLSRDEQIDAIYSPVRVVGGFILGALERNSMQIDQDGHAKSSEGSCHTSEPWARWTRNRSFHLLYRSPPRSRHRSSRGTPCADPVAFHP